MARSKHMQRDFICIFIHSPLVPCVSLLRSFSASVWLLPLCGLFFLVVRTIFVRRSSTSGTRPDPHLAPIGHTTRTRSDEDERRRGGGRTGDGVGDGGGGTRIRRPLPWGGGGRTRAEERPACHRRQRAPKRQGRGRTRQSASRAPVVQQCSQVEGVPGPAWRIPPRAQSRCHSSSSPDTCPFLRCCQGLHTHSHTRSTFRHAAQGQEGGDRARARRCACACSCCCPCRSRCRTCRCCGGRGRCCSASHRRSRRPFSRVV